MKSPDPKVTESLQTSCQILSHLAGQYQVDIQQMKALGIKWLAKRVKSWYKGTESQLRIFLQTLLYFGVDPEYDAGSVAGADSVTEVLERAGSLAYAAMDFMCASRKQAWDIQADYTPDVYEHCIEELAHQIKHIERELHLISLSGETDYILSRLGDGE